MEILERSALIKKGMNWKGVYPQNRSHSLNALFVRVDQIKDHFTCKMTRSWVLLFVLMFIVLTSQFEWNEQVENESETSSRPLILSDKEQQHIPQGKESVQVKKILFQEKKIQKLNELVRDLRRQLLQCRNENQVELTELETELDQLLVTGV
ncbi:hypothetical protein ISN45_At05g005450 [Arabidopsis thaliana x Arabidopsis arenosa]|uniref:Uncharacterized protein n=1 Tax=Arabidopsis thaliana x Arabidopsis arenosa TaxID=1240361 RepID=A0A8T2CSQ7_9BRAS|nr:hypothetical protein ISN45_At05g005450 [Arabidopsis thaliana x Arabidopsis arenosa]